MGYKFKKGDCCKRKEKAMPFIYNGKSRNCVCPPGPPGPRGATGVTGPAGEPGTPRATGERGITGVTGATGEAGAIGATGATGPSGIDRTIIQFASGHPPLITTKATRITTIAGVAGYALGTEIAMVTMTGENIDLSVAVAANDDRQFAFSVPYDCIIDRIYATVGFWTAIAAPPPNGEIISYMILYTAPAGGNLFTPLPTTRVNGVPFTTAMPQQSMTFGSVEYLGIPVVKGQRLMVVGMMEITGDGTTGKARSYYMYFTGGIGLLITE